MTVEDVSWDLSPLVHGEGDAGADRLLDEAADARAGLRRHATPAASPSSTRRAFAAAVTELQEHLRARRARRATTRCCASASTPPTRRSARSCSACRRRARRSRRSCCSSSSSGPRSTTSAPTSCWPPTASTPRATSCAPRAATARTCCPSPRRRSSPRRPSPARRRWGRLFSEQVSALTVDAARRGRAGHARRRARAAHVARPRRAPHAPPRPSPRRSQPGLRTRAFIFNTLLHDKAVDDRLRHYPNWLAARNLSNEASDESVQALLSAVRNRYELPRRWYRLKAQLLGHRPARRLRPHGRRHAGRRARRLGGRQGARARLLRRLHARARRPGARVLRRATASTPRRGRPSAAARSPPTRCPSEHPYLMLNYTAKRRDVLILAHEMGHGLHAELARPRGILEQRTPLTLAETASVFGETLVFRPPARAGRRRPSRACRCSPSRSRARSRRSSARRR